MNLFKITVDCLVFAYDIAEEQMKVLLIKRNNTPHKNKWALPGGYVNGLEEFIDTAKRKLQNETGIKNVYIEQLNAYSLTDSSPDNRIVSIAFWGLIKLQDFQPADLNSHYYEWFNINKAPSLPFDHNKKLIDAIERVKNYAQIKPLLFKLLPTKFSLNQLQRIYEEIYDIHLDNRNFRRKVKNFNYIEPLNEFEKKVSRRPSELYRFNKLKFEKYTLSSLL